MKGPLQNKYRIVIFVKYLGNYYQITFELSK